MTLHLMVGLPCSGKTTLAKQLEQQYAALRLAPDEWHIRLFGQDAEDEAHDGKHELVETLMLELAERVLKLGVDVILDYGFWVRSQRDELVVKAAELGTDVKIHFPKISNQLLFARLAARNAQLPPGAFYIPATMLEKWIPIFEPPFEDELAYTIIYPTEQ